MRNQHYEKALPRARLWTGDMEVEPQALEQIRKVTQLPILAGHVAVMPDVHLGKGATVGTVIPTRAAIVPAAVGVDLGCGVLAVKTNLAAKDLPESLAKLRAQIERDVPVGFDFHTRTARAKRQASETASTSSRTATASWKSSIASASSTKAACGASWDRSAAETTSSALVVTVTPAFSFETGPYQRGDEIPPLESEEVTVFRGT